MNQLLIALFLSIVPLIELRAGLPVAIHYALNTNVNIFLVIFLVILLNCLIVFPIFWFLDKVHIKLIKFKPYKILFNKYLNYARKKTDKFEKSHKALGFLALAIFVGIPLPGTGAYTGVFLSWLLDLDRKKSIASIFLGVIIAGILVSLITLGFFFFFKFLI